MKDDRLPDATPRFGDGTDRVWCAECGEPLIAWSARECQECGNDTFRLRPTLVQVANDAAEQESGVFSKIRRLFT